MSAGRFGARAAQSGPTRPRSAAAGRAAHPGEEPGPAVYDFVLQRDAIEGYRARYGIRWDDTSTTDDRRLGIAGSALVVLDLKSGDLIGRRTGYTLAARAAEAGTRATCPTAASDAPAGSADRDFLLALLH